MRVFGFRPRIEGQASLDGKLNLRFRLGLPPLGGFAAKFQVFSAVYETGRLAGQDAPFLRWVYFGLLALAALNTAISAGYYLRVLRTMTLDEPVEAGVTIQPHDDPVAAHLLGELLL